MGDTTKPPRVSREADRAAADEIWQCDDDCGGDEAISIVLRLLEEVGYRNTAAAWWARMKGEGPEPRRTQ